MDAPRHDRSDSLPVAIAWVAFGTFVLALSVQFVLEDAFLSGIFLSPQSWHSVLRSLDAEPIVDGGQILGARIGFGAILLPAALLSVAAWLTGGVVLLGKADSKATPSSRYVSALAIWGRTGWKWALLPAAWYVSSLASVLLGWQTFSALVARVTDFVAAVTVAGFLATAWTQMRRSDEDVSPRAAVAALSLAMLLWITALTAMNWQLYRGLLLPHGDSAMYEEHLWNLLHGKGFRSYLDQGLFFGEHIQFIHLFLIPVYLLWPSHLLLELAESIALASTAIPVYLIARRHTGRHDAALWAGLATLLYVPLHYLDIAIDLKTFRPIAFGVPLLLLAIDQLERDRLKTMAALLVLTLTAKEDYAIVIPPLGLWLAMANWPARKTAPRAKLRLIVGLVTCVVVAAYLLLAVKVLIPWFRSGETVHYARYFSQFGETPTEIVITMVTRPDKLLGQLLTINTLYYALFLLVPLAGLAFRSPGRLAVGLPLFVLLCLNELAQSPPAPVHHFHAPILPILLWAFAAGLGGSPLPTRFDPLRGRSAAGLGRAAVCSALTTAAILSFYPLSLKFWDPGRPQYWRSLYVPGRRAAEFSKVIAKIPRDARVASTDFVHPRFTHYERSYDYSGYVRAVSGNTTKVPDDTDYIVIDTQHPYSTITSPDQVPEYRDNPDEWELLPDETDGYFIILKRR